jgi:hypothetical protein
MKKLLIFVCALAVTSSVLAADLTRLDSTPGGSKVRVEGTSTIHNWQLEGKVVGGYAEVGSGFPLKPGAEATPGKVDAKISVFIPVRQLKSVEKNGEPYSASMDDVVYKHLKEAEHKRITYNLTSLTLKAAPKATDAPYEFDAEGELAVAGVTNKIKMPVTVTVIAENRVKFAGSLVTKMSDFKIDPPSPSLALGLIKTGDEIKLLFEWVAVRKAPAASTPP